MRRLLAWRGWPLAPQLAVAVALAAVVAGLALGDPNPEANLGMYLLWGLWWPLVPLSFFAAGRLWCAVCPVSLVGDAASRALPGRARLAPAFARHAAALLVVAFAGVHVANLWFRFEQNLAATLALVALLGAVAAALTLALRGRDWCVALCPLGAMGRFLARLSPLRIAGAAEACANRCAARPCEGGGAARALCPMQVDLRAGVDAGACILCGACVKACPRLGEVGWRPGGGPRRGELAAAEPFAALAFLGLAADMALTHLVDWPILFWQLTNALGIGAGPWTETALHAGIVLGPPGLAIALRRGGRVAGARAADVAALALPLAASGLLAVTLRPLIVEGPLRLQRLLLGAGSEWAVALSVLRRLDGAPLRAMQLAVVGAGVAVALAWAVRPAARGARSAGGVVFVALAGAALLWICSRPMTG